VRYPRRVDGFRSGLEQGLAAQLEGAGVAAEYEKHKVPYTDTKLHKYTPDFRLPSGVFIEAKGRFTAPDRAKHLLVKQQHPDLDIRFVFSNSKAKLSRTSKTTYADWCAKHGFQFSDKEIPKSWLK
jgi:hypothetical protein